MTQMLKKTRTHLIYPVCSYICFMVTCCTLFKWLRLFLFPPVKLCHRVEILSLLLFKPVFKRFNSQVSGCTERVFQTRPRFWEWFPSGMRPKSVILQKHSFCSTHIHKSSCIHLDILWTKWMWGKQAKEQVSYGLM